MKESEEILIKKEDADILGSEMNRLLSKFELEVLSLYLSGNSYSDIAKLIGREPKSVDNSEAIDNSVSADNAYLKSQKQPIKQSPKQNRTRSCLGIFIFIKCQIL